MAPLAHPSGGGGGGGCRDALVLVVAVAGGGGALFAGPPDLELELEVIPLSRFWQDVQTSNSNSSCVHRWGTKKTTPDIKLELDLLPS